MKLVFPKEFRSALVVFGIVLFSNLAVLGVPNWMTLYTSFIAGMLAGLVELATHWKIEIPKAKKKVLEIVKSGNKGSFFF